MIPSGFAAAQFRWTPASLPNLALWVRADAITGLADGDTVTTWTDSSSAGNNLSAGATKPVYKTNQINGLPAVSITGTQSLLLPVGLVKNLAGLTILSVVKFSSLTGDGQFAIWYLNGSGAMVQAYRSGSLVGLGGRRATTDLFQSATASGALVTTAAQMLVFRIDWQGTALNIYINGSSVASNTSFQTSGNSANTNSTSGTLGNYAGTDPLNGAIGEFIICQSALSVSNRQQAEAYLRAKWGIA